MQVGLCTISGSQRSVVAVIDDAAAAGYDGVEVWGKDHVGDRSPETCRSIADHAERASIEIAVYGSYLRAGTPAFESDLPGELAVASSLGADLIRVWAGTTEFGDHDDASMARTVDDLRTVTTRANRSGIGVTVERHAGTLTNTTTGAQRVIEGVDHPRCGLNWQPSFRMSPSAVTTDARRLAPISNNVHLQAVATQGGSDRCLLSAAYFSVEEVLMPFHDGTFDGYVNVEFVAEDRAYRAAIEADLALIRSVLR